MGNLKSNEKSKSFCCTKISTVSTDYCALQNKSRVGGNARHGILPLSLLPDSPIKVPQCATAVTCAL